jgi:SAM-dependent methyltransferase
MVFASPMPNDAALTDYNTHYFASAHQGHATSRSTFAFFSGMARLRMAHIERYLAASHIDVSNVFELGPGTGSFARNWLKKYPEAKYIAAETDLTCHPHLLKMGVQLVSHSSQVKTSTLVDLIVMSHVLEHVANPIQFLSDATQGLRKGGVLFIEVPCRDDEHKSLDEPHLLFFDKKPMQRLLNQLGFNNIQLSYHGVALNRLRSSSFLHAKWTALRSKLIALGIVSPFARKRKGMETLHDPIERAMIAPFCAHTESDAPAWWLRALATK